MSDQERHLSSIKRRLKDSANLICFDHLCQGGTISRYQQNVATDPYKHRLKD